MLYSRMAAALLCGIALLSVTACSDPAGVGGNIGRDSLSGGDPVTEEVLVSSAQQEADAPRTGFTGGGSWRVLTGRVVDDLAGTITADGYLDYAGRTARPDTIANAPVEDLNVTLTLERVYRHGDPSGPLTVELFDLSQEADMGDATADASFPTEAQPITTFDVSPSDTTTTVSLPDEWIQEHQEALQGDSLSGTFDGFKLATTPGNAIVLGFDYDDAALSLFTSADTVNFLPTQSFTHIERTNDPTTSLAADERLLLDGVGLGLAFDWTSSARLDSLLNENITLSRADITVPVDTTIYNNTGANFIRPEPTGYRLLASRRADGPSCRALNLFSRESVDDTCFLPTDPNWVPEAARASGTPVFIVFDTWLFDERPLDAFRAEIAARAGVPGSDQETVVRGLPSTIPAVVRIPSAASTTDRDELPRASLTVTPL